MLVIQSFYLHKLLCETLDQLFPHTVSFLSTLVDITMIIFKREEILVYFQQINHKLVSKHISEIHHNYQNIVVVYSINPNIPGI